MLLKRILMGSGSQEGLSKEAFEALFERVLATPLIEVGFQRHGASLHLTRGVHHLALIRLGGRMSRPGAIAQLLCHRFNFCRLLLSEKLADSVSDAEVTDYPVRLLPNQSLKAQIADWRYRPQNLRFDVDYLEFAEAPAEQTERRLRDLSKAMLEQVLPWALAITPERLAQEIEERGEDAWCERLWVEDCRSYHSSAQSQPAARQDTET